MTKRIVKADASWSGSAGGGILGPNNDGLGFGAGSQGVGHSTNLPPGFGGTTGTGTWSGSVITDERFNDKVGMETVMEWDIEELMDKIKALMKIRTPDSLNYARELKNILDKRMHELRRARRQFELVKTAEKHKTIEQMQSNPFVVAIFAEHNVNIEKLAEIDVPVDLDHYGLHDLVHKLAQSTQQPIKGKCPESGAVRYMSISDLVQHDYKAPCPEGPRRLEKIKSVSIEEYKKHKKSKKRKKKAADLGPLPLDTKWYSPDTGRSRIWMVSETGNRAFWKVKGDWREVNGDYWGRGQILSPSSPGVKEIRQQFFGEEPWSIAELKGFVKKAEVGTSEVEERTTPKAYSQPLPKEFKRDYDFTKRAVENLKKALKEGPMRVIWQYQDQIQRGLFKLFQLNSQRWPSAPLDEMHPEIQVLHDETISLDDESTKVVQEIKRDVDIVKQLSSKPTELKKALEEMVAKKSKAWVDELLDMAAPHLPEIGTPSEIVEQHEEYFSTKGLNKPLTMQDFYDFYAASLSMNLLESVKLPEGWAKPARTMVLETVNSFGDKLVRIAKDAGAKELSHILGSFAFRPTSEGMYEKFLERTQQLEQQYSTLEDFNKLRSERKLALEEMEKLYNSGEWGAAFGGKAWATIMKEVAELQAMLPATIDNLGPVIAKIDHVVDLEHNTQLFLDKYVDLGESKSGRLQDFLTEKTEDWDLGTFKQHSPKFYNLYKNLQRYAALKSLTKRAQAKAITFSPEEQQIIDVVADAAKELDIKCYLVGGAVRDRLLGKDNVDLDFMCEKDAEKLVAYLANKYKTAEPVQYDRSQAIMLTLGNQALDFINAEKLFTPLKQQESLEGEEEFTTSFDDAYRRDLTINTLMYDIVTGELLDPTGKGLKDLREKKLNTVVDPFIKYKIHATDMLRAIRFAVTLGFELGPKMLEAMKANADRVRPRDIGGDISNRRVRRELRKAIDKPEHWAHMLELLQKAGLDIVLAEDIEDVQEDFEGSIEYQWPEK